MSIDPIGGIDTFRPVLATTLTNPVNDVTPADAVFQTQPVSPLPAQQAAQDLNGVQYLTAGDRDFLTYLYGSDFVQNLSTGVLPLQSPQTQSLAAAQSAQDQAALDQVDQTAAATQAAQTRAAQNAQALQDARELAATQDLQAVQTLLTPAVPNTATQIQAAAQNPVLVPQFVQDLIDDRRSGVLPIGTEITSSYVQNQYDAYLAATGTAPVASPLTDTELQTAQDYFDRRVTGASVDLQA